MRGWVAYGAILPLFVTGVTLIWVGGGPHIYNSCSTPSQSKLAPSPPTSTCSSAPTTSEGTHQALTQRHLGAERASRKHGAQKIGARCQVQRWRQAGQTAGRGLPTIADRLWTTASPCNFAPSYHFALYAGLVDRPDCDRWGHHAGTASAKTCQRSTKVVASHQWRHESQAGIDSFAQRLGHYNLPALSGVGGTCACTWPKSGRRSDRSCDGDANGLARPAFSIVCRSSGGSHSCLGSGMEFWTRRTYIPVGSRASRFWYSPASGSFCSSGAHLFDDATGDWSSDGNFSCPWSHTPRPGASPSTWTWRDSQTSLGSQFWWSHCGCVARPRRTSREHGRDRVAAHFAGANECAWWNLYSTIPATPARRWRQKRSTGGTEHRPSKSPRREGTNSGDPPWASAATGRTPEALRRQAATATETEDELIPDLPRSPLLATPSWFMGWLSIMQFAIGQGQEAIGELVQHPEQEASLPLQHNPALTDSVLEAARALWERLQHVVGSQDESSVPALLAQMQTFLQQVRTCPLLLPRLPQGLILAVQASLGHLLDPFSYAPSTAQEWLYPGLLLEHGGPFLGFVPAGASTDAHVQMMLHLSPPGAAPASPQVEGEDLLERQDLDAP